MDSGTSSRAESVPVVITTANTQIAKRAYPAITHFTAAPSVRHANTARVTYSSVPTQIAAAARCIPVSTAPHPGSATFGWDRTPSAATTNSSGADVHAGFRIRARVTATNRASP